MALRHYILQDKDNSTIAYEEMIDGKSYMFIRSNNNLLQIPMPQWRKIQEAWTKNGWDKKWDHIDNCVPIVSKGKNDDGI